MHGAHPDRLAFKLRVLPLLFFTFSFSIHHSTSDPASIFRLRCKTPSATIHVRSFPATSLNLTFFHLYTVTFVRFPSSSPFFLFFFYFSSQQRDKGAHVFPHPRLAFWETPIPVGSRMSVGVLRGNRDSQTSDFG